MNDATAILEAAVFRLEGDLAIPTPNAAGPWNPDLQHGAAPAALIARAVERLPCAAPMRVARLTIDLMRPVPLRPLQVRASILRDGRKIQLVQVVLAEGETELVRATALRVRLADQTLPAQAAAAPLSLPPPEAGRPPNDVAEVRNPFIDGVEMRVAHGAFRTPGPAAVWFRLRRPIVAGEAITPLMRAAATADFCNGTSAVLDFAQWTFINGDLTLSLARDPVGDWILLDAESWLAPNGAGIAAGRLADRDGYFGRAAQSLLVEAR
jgi:acyl-CoA thioesterase